MLTHTEAITFIAVIAGVWITLVIVPTSLYEYYKKWKTKEGTNGQ